MANKAVYPYGTEGKLPSSIGLVNDLKTGGVNNALTAEQGKVIGEAIYDNKEFVSDNIPSVSAYDGKQLKADSTQVGKSLSSVTTGTLSTSRNYRIPVKGADSITYRRFASSYEYGCLFLDASDVVISGIISTLSDPVMRTVGVPADAEYFIWSYSPSTVSDSDERVCTVTYLKTKEINEHITEVEDSIDELKDDLYGTREEVTEAIPLMSATTDKISMDSDKFYRWDDNTHVHRAYIIPISGMSQVTIKANQAYAAQIFISKSIVPVGTTNGSTIRSNYMATGCDGYSPSSGSDYKMALPAGDTVTINVSKNAAYLYIQKNYGSTSNDYSPESVVLTGIVRKNGKLDNIGESSNGLFDGISFSQGTLDEKGELQPDNTHLVSNPIPTSSGYYVQTNYPLYKVESVALFDNGGKCVNRKFFTFINGITGKNPSFGSVVCIGGYYVRFVLEKSDGTEASPNDLILKNFALFNDPRLKRIIPNNNKFQYFLERIKAQTNVVWKAITKVPAPNQKLPYYYDGGTVNFGLPYSDVGEYSKYVGFDVSLRTFLTALLNPRSVMYTENVSSEAPSSKYGISYHNYENAAGAYYGSVCSDLTGYALGLPNILTSALYGDGKISGESVIAKGGEGTYYIKDGNSWTLCDQKDILDLIQPMDLITSPGHVSFISDIYTDEYGNKKFIIWTEETRGQTPVAKSTPNSIDRFFARFDGYSLSDGWQVIRYSNWDDVVPVQGDRDCVPMEWFEYPKNLTIDPDICTYAGDYVVFQIGDAADTLNNNKAFLNIHRNGDKYDTLQIFAEDADESTDTPVATVDISANSGTFIYNSTNIFADDAADKDDWIVVDLKQLPTALTHGKYKARVVKDGGTATSGFTHFQMVDVNFTVTGTGLSDLVCNYSSEEGTPFYIRRERRDGLGAHNGSTSYQRVIPEGETSCTNPRNWAINSTNRYVKVFFKADYGTAVKRIDVYGQFNS